MLASGILFCDFDSHVDAYLTIPSKHRTKCPASGGTLFFSSEIVSVCEN